MERVQMNVGMANTSRLHAPTTNNHQPGTSPIASQSLSSVHFGSERRSYTSATASDSSTPPPKATQSLQTHLPTPPANNIPPQQFLHLLPQTRHLVYPSSIGNTTTSTIVSHTSGSSSTRSDVSPSGRIHDGQSTEGAAGVSASGMMNGTSGWTQGGRKGDTRRNNQAAPRGNVNVNGVVQGKKDVAQTVRQPSNRRSGSTQSNLSSSLPSTPNHQPRQIASKSRSPSPHASLLDSPKSAASEPIVASQKQPNPPDVHKACKYETLLSTVRRRFMYTIGSDYLPRETPEKGRLSPEEDLKLTNDMLALFDELLPTPESNERRAKLVVKLETLLNRTWPGHDFRVIPFGSSENKLCTTESDVDVCIITKVTDQASHTCAIAKALADSGMTRVICVPTAKVPIVKIWDPELSVACDMNVNNTLALENTRMIKTYVEIDPRVQRLAMIVKHWTKQRLLNDALGATLGSYTWLCMILNYLQTRDPPILPSLHERPHKPRPPVQGVDCSFDDDLEGLRGFGEKNKESLGSLLFGFFKFYGYEVDYENSVMSVRLGRIITKEEKGWHFGHNNIICVEEPFNTGRNLSNTCDPYSARGLHQEFRRAFKILAEKLDLKALCEAYVFPPDEAPSYVPPPPQPKPTLTRNHTPSNRGRGGQGRGNRSFYNSKQSQYNRRTNNQSNFSPVQQQYIGMPDLYMLQPTQLYQADNINLNMAHLQAQNILYANYIQATALQAQLNSQQNGTQNASQQASTQDGAAAFSPLANLAHMMAYPFFYAPLIQPTETAATPASPPSTPSASDSRNHMGRGRRNGAYTPRSRSRTSREPSVARYGSSNFTPAAPQEDDEFDLNDVSSNGSMSYNQFHPPPPETPPEEENAEVYVGYFIGDSLQEGFGPAPSSLVEEEPFVQQKYIVDRQKRLSQEKLPPPLLRKSCPPSPRMTDREHYSQEPLNSDVRRKQSHERHYEDRGGPLIVNGSTCTQSPLYPETAYTNASMGTNSPSTDTFIYSQPFEPSGGLAARYVAHKASDHAMHPDESPVIPRHLNRMALSPALSPITAYAGISTNYIDASTGPAPQSPVVLCQYSTGQQRGWNETKQPLESSKIHGSTADLPLQQIPVVEIGPAAMTKQDASMINGEVTAQLPVQVKQAQTVDVKPTSMQNGTQKKQTKTAAPQNMQPKRKTSKPQATPTAPLVAVPIDTISIVPAKTIPKEPAKASTWTKKTKAKKNTKKAVGATGSERREPLAEGERKGG